MDILLIAGWVAIVLLGLGAFALSGNTFREIITPPE